MLLGCDCYLLNILCVGEKVCISVGIERFFSSPEKENFDCFTIDPFFPRNNRHAIKTGLLEKSLLKVANRVSKGARVSERVTEKNQTNRWWHVGEK